MNLDHFHDPEKEVRNWIAVAARMIREAKISQALIWSVSVSSDGEYVFYKEDLPNTPEGDRMLDESLGLSTEQHNYLSLFWVGLGFLNALGTDNEAAYKKEFEVRAEQAERGEYAKLVISSENRKRGQAKAQNPEKAYFIRAYQYMVEKGEVPSCADLIFYVSKQKGITASADKIAVTGSKGVTTKTCSTWLTELKKATAALNNHS